ncbi:low molecular weight protein-tyrosine-phosphatase [Streptomyces sp. 6N223]|uniref:low molecular weight protein-tyrosine-phosphatase n=1 Tax=Streptomyces sp. 6N223 TaxID=3457412 RepID=UPI003FD023B7
MYRICFVCTGNICRSPMAEAVCRQHLARRGLAERVVVDSAGTGSWHAGEGADPRAEAALVAAGYELQHIARQFRRGWFDRYDLVIALDRGHERSLRRLATSPGQAARVRLLRAYDLDAAADGDLDVPDPYYGGDTGFAACLKLIEDAMPGLLDEVQGDIEGSAGNAESMRETR